MMLAFHAGLLLCSSIAHNPDASAPMDPWRHHLAVLAAPQWMQAESLRWFGDGMRGGAAVRFERHITPYASAAVDLGMGLQGDDGLLSLDVYEVRPALQLSWPRARLGGWLLPYGRTEVPLALAVVRAGDARSRSFIPGVAVSVGLRAQPRGRAGRTPRLYAFVEAGYAWRLSRIVRLDGPDDRVIAGPSTRLGALDLSAIEGRVGIGWGF